MVDFKITSFRCASTPLHLAAPFPCPANSMEKMIVPLQAACWLDPLSRTRFWGREEKANSLPWCQAALALRPLLSLFHSLSVLRFLQQRRQHTTREQPRSYPSLYYVSLVKEIPFDYQKLNQRYKKRKSEQDLHRNLNYSHVLAWVLSLATSITFFSFMNVSFIPILGGCCAVCVCVCFSSP